MTIVVSDTSPIRALHHLGLLDLLQLLYGHVLVPPAVAAELLAPKQGMAVIDLKNIGFVEIRAPQFSDRLRSSVRGLDPGESEALTLAVEAGVETVLMDEAAGRAVAKQLGLMPLGVIGVLVQAKQDGLVPAVGPLVDRLRAEIQFFISESLRNEALRLAGEGQS